jgi:ketosteroid isomerase-like protein
VGIGGQFIRGRKAIEDFFTRLLKAGSGMETATIEQIRFLSPDLAIVDGSWTITGLGTRMANNYRPCRARM